MKIKGFTLIELLAVVIILSIITLVATPIVLSVIENAEKDSFKNGAYGILRSAQVDYSLDSLGKNEEAIIFTYNDGVESANIIGKTLDYDGNKPKDGKLKINGKGEIALAIHNGKYCASKRYEDKAITLKKISLEECLLELAPISQFVTTFGGSNDAVTEFNSNGEVFQTIKTIEDGYIALGCTNANNGDLSGLSNGQTDAIIVKYDFDGNVIWKKTYGSSDNEIFSNIIVTSDAYYAFGYRKSSHQEISAIIVKYKFDGSVIAESTYGAYGDGSASSFIGGQLSGNDIVVVGITNLPTSGHGQTPIGFDAFIAKYDQYLNLLWSKNYGGDADDVFTGIEVLDDGYVLVGQITEADAVILKLNSDNNIAWTRSFGGSNADMYNNLIKVEDGFLAFGYSSSSNGDMAGLSRGSEDAIVVKYDFNGNVVWKRAYGGSLADRFNGAKEVEDGYILVGSSKSNDGDLLGLNKGDEDGIVVKYDFNGNIIWKQNFGGSNKDTIYGIDVFDGTYTIVGLSKSNDGDFENLNNGNADAFIAKYSYID